MRSPDPGGSGLVEGGSAVLTGLGALTYAFFPLAMPIVALTVVALIPFLVAGLAIGLAAAIVASPVLLALWLRGRIRGRAAGQRAEGERRPSGVPGGNRALREVLHGSH
jgi:hypothetical protein